MQQSTESAASSLSLFNSGSKEDGDSRQKEVREDWTRISWKEVDQGRQNQKAEVLSLHTPG